MSEINLDVSGMACSACVNHVTKALQPLEGVENIDVDLAAGKVKVKRATYRTDDLIAALNEDGYPSSLDLDGSIQAPTKKSGGCCCG